MSQGRNNQSPPPTMTWARAMPVIIVAGVLDAFRIFFEMFWFFGPALAAVACTSVANDALNTSVAAMTGKLVAAGCTTVAGVAGFFGVEITGVFGVVMAEAFGFLGFLILAFWVIATNARLFKANESGMFWLVGSLVISEIPFIGTLPAFSVTLWRLYSVQIKKEQKARKEWEKTQDEIRAREREEQAAELIQIRAAQEEELEAANEEIYAQDAQDGEIPETLPRAA